MVSNYSPGTLLSILAADLLSSTATLMCTSEERERGSMRLIKIKILAGSI